MRQAEIVAQSGLCRPKLRAVTAGAAARQLCGHGADGGGQPASLRAAWLGKTPAGDRRHLGHTQGRDSTAGARGWATHGRAPQLPAPARRRLKGLLTYQPALQAFGMVLPCLPSQAASSLPSYSCRQPCSETNPVPVALPSPHAAGSLSACSLPAVRHSHRNA